MDDEPHAYLRLSQQPVDLAPLATTAARFPELRVIVYGNSQVADAALAAGLLNLSNVWFGLHLPDEPSSTAIVRRFAGRMVLGSWAPLQEVAAAEKQLRSAAPSADELKDALGSRARRLLR
jgi:hypothetical protein